MGERQHEVGRWKIRCPERTDRAGSQGWLEPHQRNISTQETAAVTVITVITTIKHNSDTRPAAA